jgi:hypothetical protein
MGRFAQARGLRAGDARASARSIHRVRPAKRDRRNRKVVQAGASPPRTAEAHMNNPIDDAYDEWKKADAAARALEREVSDTWYRHDFALGPAPARDLLREAAWLRHDASEKLAHAVRLLHHTGNIQPPKSAAPGHSTCAASQ